MLLAACIVTAFSLECEQFCFNGFEYLVWVVSLLHFQPNLIDIFLLSWVPHNAF